MILQVIQINLDSLENVKDKTIRNLIRDKSLTELIDTYKKQEVKIKYDKTLHRYYRKKVRSFNITEYNNCMNKLYLLKRTALMI